MKKRRHVKHSRILGNEDRFQRKTFRVALFSVTILSSVLFFETQSIQASEMDGKWEPRSIEQIKKDINGKKEYTIVWGDTLSGISLATNITMEKLSSLNGIGDYNLIYAGNKLIFEGDVVIVQNQDGVVTDQQQITESDKLNSNQPIGESVSQADQSSADLTAQKQTDAEQPLENNGDIVSTPSTPITDDSQNANSVDNSTSGNETSNSGETTNPTPTPTPDPAPTPTPEEPQVQYTVWFYAYEGDDQSMNIERGVRLFTTEAEATTFIDNYADNLLMQGVAGSYGVMSWQ